MNLERAKIAIIGLGYVGLPLAVEFGKYRHSIIGFDISEVRLAELRSGRDTTLEVSEDELAAASEHIVYTSKLDDLKDCDVFIVTVPTPIDQARRPEFTPLIKATETVGSIMQDGAIVIYESTVYPGATEEICVPILEKFSGKIFNVDFYCGYSPERINPGDKLHRLASIKKVTSGSTPEVGRAINELYASIIPAGTHLAPSIKVAEAAKVIENTQRDLNIALMNELSLIFDRLNIDTLEVLEAAGTKWNFLPFRPGLVGGHCIGVDPYYLTHKAQEVGYHPEVVLAGRRINDSMGYHVADQVLKLLLRKGIELLNARVLVLGLTFKENCPDLRNTKVVETVRRLEDYTINVDVFDPWINLEEAWHEYGLRCLAQLPREGDLYDAVVLAVAHDQFKSMGAQKIRRLCRPNSVIFDVKAAFPRDAVEGRL